MVHVSSSALAPYAIGLATGMLTLSAAAQPLKAAEDGRPNIIFVLVDDQRYDAFGAMTPGLQTPALDRLLRDGLHFENAFVTTSLCSPSRASIMTSQLMREHGVIDNNAPTPETLRPFAVELDAAGYDTAFIGKWHMGNDDASPKPGFDHWVSFEGQGNYGPVDAFGRPSLLNVNGADVPQVGYITDELTSYALDWLGEYRDAPFFLFLSHKAVHLPFTPAARHADQYETLTLERPETADLSVRSGQTPMWLSAQRNSWAGVEFPYYATRSMEDFQRDYYAALSAVDDSVGALLEATSSRPGDRDTVILYSSDNGFMFGEQGLLDKRAAYEASIRVPLIIHSPERFGDGRTVRDIARNIDIAPTVLGLADVPAPESFRGRDLLSDTEPEALIYEYYWEYNYPQTPTTFAVRTERFKYIQYHGVWDTEELFDLTIDPHETTNLIDAPEHLETVVEMRAALHQALSSGDAGPRIPFSPRVNQGAVFWSETHSDGLSFPPEWRRDAEAADKYEHFIPDGPTKDRQLQAITPRVRTILDGEMETEEPSQ